jgi:20S proteasome alpha/beta subunit|tara:strand:+ start:673 stop:861 length:189 start_codon:yes stop_codon:yes gene_type:complete
MSLNLWDKERNRMFWTFVKEYQEEGYSKQEAKKLAKKEVNEVMEDKKDFVNELYNIALDNYD